MSVGNHVGKDGVGYSESIKNSISRAAGCKVKMKCAQIFIIGPQNSKENIQDEDIAQLSAITETGFQIFVHSSYLSNPWGAKPAFGVHLIRRELELADKFKSAGVVIHLANKPPETIAEMLPKLLEHNPKTRLYLEIDSYKATEGTYETPKKISQLFNQISSLCPQVKSKIGICIDTAHLWAAGTDISSYNSAKSYINAMLTVCGYDEDMEPEDKVPIMVHLNDQIWSIGSGRDKHAPLAFGTIWGIYNNDLSNLKESGLYAFVELMLAHPDISFILERKEDSPKINDRPLIDNIISDYMILNKLGISD